MAAKNIPKHEPRTRVVFNLPVNDWGEEKAFYEVIGHLRGLKDRRSGVTGFTYSDPMPAVFTGFWWSDDQQIWMEDAIVIVMIDFSMPSPSARFSVSGEMTKLKRFISATYRRNGSRQEEVWIVAHRVTRQS
ncbi:MAG TPA: hypothetical protein VNH11_20115 [Pirellulales bacterium]|nr:hypothetical protein [Pirellulales bacterium]